LSGYDEGRVGIELLVDVERKPEVGDLHVVLVVDEDVGRLDVAMHDALPVGMIERHAALEDDADRAVYRQQLVEAAVALQRATRKVLHHHIGLCRLDRSIVDADDVGVVQTARHHLLGPEQLDQAAVPLRLVLDLVIETHMLDGDRLGPVVRLGEVDDRGSTTSDLLDDPVFADPAWSRVHTFAVAAEPPSVQ